MIPKTMGRRANEAFKFTPTRTCRITLVEGEGTSLLTKALEARVLWLPCRARGRGKLRYESNSPPSSRSQRSESHTCHLRLPAWPRVSHLFTANSTKATPPNGLSSRSGRGKSWSSTACNNKRNTHMTSCRVPTAARLTTKILTSTDTAGPAQDRVRRGKPKRSFRENHPKFPLASTLQGRPRSLVMLRLRRVV